MKARVEGNDGESERFDITNGTKQGCVPAPTLFGIVITAMITCALEDSALEGVEIHFRIDGSVYNLSH